VSAGLVLLWRHGRTPYNVQHRFQGQIDVALDEVGTAQAERAAESLADWLKGLGPVRIVSSDLVRAWDTAGALGGRLGVEVEPDRRLREVFAGAWEGLHRDEIGAEWAEDYAAWRRGDDVRVGGGETRAEAGGRAAECIAELDAEQDGGVLVCVSHGGALRGAIFALLGAGGLPWRSVEPLRNAHWAEMRNSPHGWVLGAYNAGPRHED
jgi:probable phosphoglycerate mutase